MSTKSKEIDLKKYDLYELLNVPKFANEKQLKKAYKKQALKIHPDKNPNNPNAAQQFQLLQKAFELLSDPIQKDAYDNIIKAKEIHERKQREMDAERKRFADKLVADEAKAKKLKEDNDEQELQQKLRIEVMKQLDKEKEEFEEKRRIKMKEMQKVHDDGFNVKVKWTAKQGSYSHSDLENLFSKYGKIKEIVLSSNKKGLCMIQYTKQFEAVASLNEMGRSSCPLKVSPMFEIKTESVDDFDAFEEQVLRNLREKTTTTTTMA